MGELNYLKRKCSLGHWSQVFPKEGPIPEKCPICGQPYDRRRNRPVPCREDGSIPGNVTDTDSDHPADTGSNTNSTTPENTDYMAAEPQMRRRKRRAANLQDHSQDGPGLVGSAELVPPPRRKRSISEVGPSRENTRSSDQYYLISAGNRIPVPEEGTQIGREGIYAEMCSLNPLISRNHAQISVDHKRGGVRLIDMNSLNGTYIDDGHGRRRLEEQESFVVNAGSRFWLADQLFIIDT